MYGQTFWIKTLKWPHSNPSLDWSWDQVREGDGLVDDSSIYISQQNIESLWSLCHLVRIVWIHIIFQSLILTNPFREPCSTSPRPGRLRQSQQFSASRQYGPSSVPQRQAQQPCQKWPQNPWQADGEYKKPCRLLIQEVSANFCFSCFIYLNLYIGLKG